ncbi:MAG: hypothetical protein QXP39_01765 [Candidatus Aenigmatarchaeota archaeon]
MSEDYNISELVYGFDLRQYPVEFQDGLKELYFGKKEVFVVDDKKTPLENLLEFKPDVFYQKTKTYADRRQELIYKIRDEQKNGKNFYFNENQLSELVGIAEQFAHLRKQVTAERSYREIERAFSISKYLTDFIQTIANVETDGFYKREINKWKDMFYREPSRFLNTLHNFLLKSDEAKKGTKKPNWKAIEEFRNALASIPTYLYIDFDRGCSAFEFEYYREKVLKVINELGTNGIENGKDDFTSLVLVLQQLGFEKEYHGGLLPTNTSKYISKYAQIANDILNFYINDRKKEEILNELSELEIMRQNESLMGHVNYANRNIPIFMFFSEISEFLKNVAEGLEKFKIEILPVDAETEGLPELSPDDLKEV